MNHRGAFAALIVSSVLGIGCTVWMTLYALSLDAALLAFAAYTLIVGALVWAVATLYQGVRASAERYRSLFQSLSDAVLILDGSRIVECNSAAERILGYSRAQLLSRSLDQLCAARQPDGQTSDTLMRSFVPAALAGGPSRTEWVLAKGDGTPVECEVSVSRFEHGRSAHAQLLVRDISDRKRAERVQAQLEANLRWAQKMEAVGTLAGGVAHDFNNLMHAVTGYAELLLIDESNRAIAAELEEIREAAVRASTLTRQLLLFSRRVESDLQPLDVRAEVERIGRILERTIPKMVEIDLVLSSELSQVNADPGQVEQVLVNLALNASDAMPDGGKLVFEARNQTLESDYADARVNLAAGDYVVVTVTDTGQGMDRATLDRIFEPFFTTKDPGKGTGLGLAMVYGIVKAHGGQITCYSEPGVGTTFNVYFPALQDAARRSVEPASEAPIPRGSELVLLVDDERQVRKVARQLLESYGYRVMEAETGEAALRHFEGEHAVDLVILDYIMPGMGGRRCLERLRDLAPDVPVIISTGYSAEATSDELLRAGAQAFVGKPYQSRTLLRVVRRVLDARGSQAQEQAPVLH
jgi:PAS domain S-box-containing protein